MKPLVGIFVFLAICLALYWIANISIDGAVRASLAGGAICSKAVLDDAKEVVYCALAFGGIFGFMAGCLTKG